VNFNSENLWVITEQGKAKFEDVYLEEEDIIAEVARLNVEENLEESRFEGLIRVRKKFSYDSLFDAITSSQEEERDCGYENGYDNGSQQCDDDAYERGYDNGYDAGKDSATEDIRHIICEDNLVVGIGTLDTKPRVGYHESVN